MQVNIDSSRVFMSGIIVLVGDEINLRITRE